MKLFVVATVVILSMQAQAKTISFKCVPSPASFMNQFMATGQAKINSKNEIQAVTALKVSTAGHRPSVTSFDSIQLSGILTVLPAGQFAVNEVNSLQLNSEDSDIHAKLNLGLKGAASSSVLIDGTKFNSECAEAK